MDIWDRIEQLKEKLGMRSDAELARSIETRPGKCLSDGYFWNVRTGSHRLGPKVVEILAQRMLEHGILATRLEELEFKEACVKMPVIA